MGKDHVGLKQPVASQRRLNIIYFIDSAKTRSITVPLGRLNIMIVLIISIFSWSIASVFVIAWLGREQNALSTRLKASLGTIFEYQSRFDNVYEVAYPPASHTPDTGFDPAPAGLRSEEFAEHPPTEPAAAPVSPPAQPAPEQQASPPAEAGQAASASSPPAGASPGGEASASAGVSQAQSPQTVSPAASQGQPAEPKSASQMSGDVGVTVGNTTLEKGSNFVALRFDLTNRSSSTRAEGFIWAVAEFVADDGQKYFIGAPRELKLNTNGDPTNPEKSTYFGIKRFKKQSFTFPLLKGRSGTFTAVRIGVMDLSGEKRRAYRLSTEVRVR